MVHVLSAAMNRCVKCCAVGCAWLRLCVRQLTRVCIGRVISCESSSSSLVAQVHHQASTTEELFMFGTQQWRFAINLVAGEGVVVVEVSRL